VDRVTGEANAYYSQCCPPGHLGDDCRLSADPEIFA
jgi:hypothetical protein